MRRILRDTAAPALTVHDLHVRIGGALVLDRLNLDVHAGELLVLLGPSGCGKSTLLHAIAGLADVEAGRVRIGDRDVTGDDPKDRGIGMVFQSYALYPAMSVERNLSFGARVAGLPRPDIEHRVRKVARMLQIDDLLHRKPAQLSGGQRQRVAIGRALMREGRVFLFDEPLSNLDAQLRAELRREIKLLHRALGATMVVVTHDQTEAMNLATRVAVMRRGRIEQIDTPKALYSKPANVFVAGFLGTPGMNLISGRVDAVTPQGAVFVAGAMSVVVPRENMARTHPPGTPALLGIRAEHIALRADPEAIGQVALVEPLGPQPLVWLDLDGQRIAALVATPEEEPVVGARLRPIVDAAHACLFDPDSGERL